MSPPSSRELDTAAVDPPPPPPKKLKGEKGRKGRKGRGGAGREAAGQTKGADKRQDAQWGTWADSSWDGTAAWWSGNDTGHD